MVSPEHAGRALNYVEQAFSPLGLTLNVAKCKWWCGQAGVAPTGLPASVQRAGVLPVLGSSLPYVVASELEHLDLLDAEAPLAQARDAFHAYWQNLCKFRCAGLCLDTTLNLQEVYVNGAITHHLRAKLVTQEWCEWWDEAVLPFWELEMQRNLASHQRWQFYLAWKLAGSGVQSAKLRRAAAFRGS